MMRFGKRVVADDSAYGMTLNLIDIASLTSSVSCLYTMGLDWYGLPR